MDLNLWIIFILYIITILFTYSMKFLNLNYLKIHGDKIPQEFEGHIDSELLNKTKNYTFENNRFGYINSIFSNLLEIIFIFGGLLNIYNSWIMSYNIGIIIEHYQY